MQSEPCSNLKSIELAEMMRENRTWLVLSWPKGHIDNPPLYLHALIDTATSACLGFGLTFGPAEESTVRVLDRLLHIHHQPPPLRVCVDSPELHDVDALTQWCAQHGIEAVCCSAAEHVKGMRNFRRGFAQLLDAIADVRDPATVLSLAGSLEDWRSAYNATLPIQ